MIKPDLDKKLYFDITLLSVHYRSVLNISKPEKRNQSPILGCFKSHSKCFRASQIFFIVYKFSFNKKEATFFKTASFE